MLCGWCATRRRHCCVRMMSSLRHHLPFSTSLTFLSFPPQTRFRLFPLPFLPLPHRLTQTSLMRHTLNTRLRLTRLRHDLDSTHFKSLHTTHSYSPVSTSVPPAFFSFIMGLSLHVPLPIPVQSFPTSLTDPLVPIYLSDANVRTLSGDVPLDPHAWNDGSTTIIRVLKAMRCFLK